MSFKLRRTRTATSSVFCNFAASSKKAAVTNLRERLRSTAKVQVFLGTVTISFVFLAGRELTIKKPELVDFGKLRENFFRLWARDSIIYG